MTDRPGGAESTGARDHARSRAGADAFAFLSAQSTEDLLSKVGRKVDGLGLSGPELDKRHFPRSYGGGKPCGDDVLTGRGVFYITESGRLMLDCVSGHYQMTWGYNHPELIDGLRRATEAGIVWDGHANTPAWPVKRLADTLVDRTGGELDRVFLGVCTGSVACETAFKLVLLQYRAQSRKGTPVIIVLNGNYHGTNMVPQSLRGMWCDMVQGFDVVTVEPNDTAALDAAFSEADGRVAGFWAEPILMNREVMLVDAAYLQRAQEHCRAEGALFVVDEIQTGFWYPEVLYYRRCDISPDIVIVGKGMTAGFHPLAGLLYGAHLDLLEQYDAINTNGNASLAAYMGLCSLAMIEEQGDRVAAVATQFWESMNELPGAYPDMVESVNGDGLLCGVKFRDREDALGCHAALVERGLWLRAHAYHEGHRTVLTKLPLAFDTKTVDFVIESFRSLLKTTSWR